MVKKDECAVTLQAVNTICTSVTASPCQTTVDSCKYREETNQALKSFTDYKAATLKKNPSNIL